MTNIRLVIPRPHESAQLRREAIDRLYCAIGGVALALIVWGAVWLHAAASGGMG